jgi:DNA (cytosine-5)-methyltransferase 1
LETICNTSALNVGLNLMSETFIPNYKWKLTDLEKVKKNGLKVFSCFACGGGSTMGYKLAGFDVIGANDIDPEMAWHYKENHKPKHYYLEDIRKFRQREDLPKEFYNLDILDGSPPCSSFSMAGSREKGWGKKKVFREGQAEQVLDDLFFDFIELARKLQPKVVIAENVKGMLAGNARGYVKQIIGLFNVAGYNVQLFLLNGATMGVPQMRERVFFVCSRKDLKEKGLRLGFNQKPISVKQAFDSIAEINTKGKDLSSSTMKKYWDKCKPGEAFSKYHPQKSLFTQKKIQKDGPCFTLTAGAPLWHYDSPRKLSQQEACVLGSYPLDYKFKKDDLALYMIGMSVPPLMTYGVADQIYKQWFR